MKKFVLYMALFLCSTICVSAANASSVEIEGFQGTVVYNGSGDQDEPYSTVTGQMYVSKQSTTVRRGYMEFDLTAYFNENIQIDAITKITITTTNSAPPLGYLAPSNGFYLFAMDFYEDGTVLGLQNEFNSITSNFKQISYPGYGILEIELTGDELAFVTDDILAGKTITGFIMMLYDEFSVTNPTGVEFSNYDPVYPVLTIEYDTSSAPTEAVPEPLTVVMVLFGSIASIIRAYKRS